VSGLHRRSADPALSDLIGDLGIGLDRALIEALELKLTIHRPFVSGLPAGEFVSAGVEGSTYGRFASTRAGGCSVGGRGARP
jgi:hypothetical protein